MITIWVVSVIISLAVVLYDVFTRNRKLTPVIMVFWILIIVLLSIFGVVLYYFLGRKRV
ncbi:PLDc N-terminal domain-containing protein [Methanosarcina horonobensis]|uniref:PLDc N-terminal domain-containing protein n=1 Tax=Methanosarcina horonobensis TaxID=418008 RepID=UPI000AB93B01|nr:PLDc N-terminal domain-containing protein [Methanosarcina horonobensis]